MTARRRENDHKGWSFADLEALLNLYRTEAAKKGRRAPGMKGRLNWKRIGKRLARSPAACQQQFSKIMRGEVPGVAMPADVSISFHDVAICVPCRANRWADTLP